MIKWSQKWFLLLAMLPACFAYADFDEYGATPQEAAMCKATIYDVREAANARDPSNIGNWAHMHHYCDCIRFTNRAMTPSKTPRKEKLGEAIQNCNYVFSHTTPDFYMLPYVHLQKGKALRMLGQDGPASAEFFKALSQNPKLPAAYQEISDFYVRIGKREEALKITSEGLKHVPDSKALQRRYTELGGKLPYPEPLEKEQTAAAPPPDPAKTADVKVIATPGQNNQEKSPPNEPIDAAKQETNPPPSNSTMPIGSPNNPYCRFCPDVK